VGWKEVEGGGVIGTLETAEREFTSSVADLKDAAISFLSVATPEEGESAQEHLEAIHAAVDEVLAMAIRLDRRANRAAGLRPLQGGVNDPA
jgi:UDP-glucose 6-dehydrogenase